MRPGTIPRSTPNRFLRSESRCSQPTIGNYATLVYKFFPIDEVHPIWDFEQVICPMNLRLGQHKKTSSLIRHQINLKVNLKNEVFARILEKLRMQGTSYRACSYQFWTEVIVCPIWRNFKVIFTKSKCHHCVNGSRCETLRLRPLAGIDVDMNLLEW